MALLTSNSSGTVAGGFWNLLLAGMNGTSLVTGAAVTVIGEIGNSSTVATFADKSVIESAVQGGVIVQDGITLARKHKIIL